MPEKDRFEKSLGPGWCASYQYVKNDKATPEEINDRIVKSLAKCLRQNDGVPGIQEIVKVVVMPLEHVLPEKFEALDNIVRDHEGHRHTKIVVNVAKSILVQLSYGGGTLEPMNLVHRLAEDSCSALIRHYFFDKVSQRLIAAGSFANYAEFHKWQIKVEKSIHPRIEKIAAQLIGNSPTRKIRAPRSVAPKMSTTELLTEVLV